MPKLTSPEFEQQRPVFQMAPLIDIVFLTLVFFMSLSIFSQMETEISISVPKAQESKETVRSPGEIIINVKKDGSVIVNQKQLTVVELQEMLRRVSTLFPNQPVIIRADEDAFHKYVVKVLDACAHADIWDISFATIKDRN